MMGFQALIFPSHKDEEMKKLPLNKINRARQISRAAQQMSSVDFWHKKTYDQLKHGMLQMVLGHTYPSMMWLGDESSGSWWACDA